MKVLVTGGAGFIGSNFILYWNKNYPNDQIVNLDKLTYAGHIENLKDLEGNSNYQFVEGDICDSEVVESVMDGVDYVVHFAAESHNDRAVLDPLIFVKTNVLGTANLLHVALKKKVKKFHHVSTDEVFGHLGKDDPPFNDKTPYHPRAPYSASKAGADHLVRAFFITFGLPITITNCTNNYGPFQDPEKLIPRFITNLLEDKKVPLMGKGENIRDWLYVEDHCRAIDLCLTKGIPGETYLVGGEERSNLEITKKILELLGKDENMIEYVGERLGHDFRYAMDASKIERELGWVPEHNFDEWFVKTVDWYKDNAWWWKPLKEGRPIVDRVAQQGYNK